MPLAILLRKNSRWGLHRKLNHNDVTKAINGHIVTSIWEKIKDWLCGTNKDEIIKKISNLTHNNENLSVASVLEKIKIFYEIKRQIEPVYHNEFKMSFEPTREEGKYAFSFSIGDITHRVYGNAKNDLDNIKEHELTNDNEFLDEKTVSESNNVNENFNVKSILEKIKIFYAIKQEIEFNDNDKFKISFKEEGEGKYAFSFSIGDRTHTVYGNAKNDLDNIKKYKLTNGSQFLAEEIVVEKVGESHDTNEALKKALEEALEKAVKKALKEVEYYIDNEGTYRFTGVSSSNQERLNTKPLKDNVKDKMVNDPSLAQKWLSLNMQSFDYYADQHPPKLVNSDGHPNVDDHPIIFGLTNYTNAAALKFLAEEFNNTQATLG